MMLANNRTRYDGRVPYLYIFVIYFGRDYLYYDFNILLDVCCRYVINGFLLIRCSKVIEIGNFNPVFR